MFHDILNAFLERKQAFLNYKNKELNNLKTWDFLQVHGLGKKKFKIFLVFLFTRIGQENVFDDILERKESFSFP